MQALAALLTNHKPVDELVEPKVVIRHLEQFGILFCDGVPAHVPLEPSAAVYEVLV
ncbi:hypothetical protein D3C85_707760 [compost metagenome]